MHITLMTEVENRKILDDTCDRAAWNPQSIVTDSPTRVVCMKHTLPAES